MKPVSAAAIGYAVCVAVVCASLMVAAHAQHAAVGVRRNLADLTDEAAVIVHGTIVAATVEPDPIFPNLTTVLVSMNVHEVLKGTAGKSFSFRQYVWDIRARTKSAGYAKGQEILLFLRPSSRYGLSSPAGLEQGLFTVRRDAIGRVVAINGLGNLGLLDHLSAGARARGIVLPAVSQTMKLDKEGAADLDGIKQIVRAIAGAKQ